MNHPKLPATIVDEPSHTNGHNWLVLTDSGEYHTLNGVCSPKDAKKGDKGYLQYVSTRSYGLYFWSKE